MMWRKTTLADAVDDIGYQLDAALSGNSRVLWLVSGGSNIENQIKILQHIDVSAAQLVVMPADERFGQYDHADSNAAQLRAAGFNYPIVDLLAERLGFAETVGLFTERIRQEMSQADYVFATLGMGADGHIVGALPHSLPVASVDAAAGFEGPDYERFSVTLRQLQRCDEIAVIAYGGSKAPALRQLRAHTETTDELPATALYACGNVTIYNDQLGG